MAVNRAAAGAAGKRQLWRTRAGIPTQTAAQPPNRERRFVDVDPWAVLLEQLTEMPEEEPTRRKGSGGK